MTKLQEKVGERLKAYEELYEAAEEVERWTQEREGCVANMEVIAGEYARDKMHEWRGKLRAALANVRIIREGEKG